MPVDPPLNRLTWKIIECALAVHRALGPGLLDSAYVACLVIELRRSGLRVALDVRVPLVYQGMRLDVVYVVDMIVEDMVVLEIKAVLTVMPVHEAQLVTYLKLTGKPLGLLLNVSVSIMKDGIARKIST